MLKTASEALERNRRSTSFFPWAIAPTLPKVFPTLTQTLANDRFWTRDYKATNSRVEK
jgi:hypothetical protein